MIYYYLLNFRLKEIYYFLSFFILFYLVFIFFHLKINPKYLKIKIEIYLKILKK